jgi:hypothetical protein
MKINPILFLFVLLLVACNNQSNKKMNALSDEEPPKSKVPNDTIVTSDIHIEPSISVEGIVLQKIYTDTVRFKEFNDDGDYFLFIATKGKEEMSLIYSDDILNRNDFARGDEIRIEWELDSIRYAGDEEVLDFAKWLRKAKKIKDGKVSLFRKEHNKEITYVPNTAEANYSDSFIDRVRIVVEYVVANSKAETLQRVLNTPKATIFYSIKEIEKENRIYYAFHISSELDGQLNDIQQIYQDVETGVLFGYDPLNDMLISLDQEDVDQ